MDQPERGNSMIWRVSEICGWKMGEEFALRAEDLFCRRFEQRYALCRRGREGEEQTR